MSSANVAHICSGFNVFDEIFQNIVPQQKYRTKQCDDDLFITCYHAMEHSCIGR